MSDGEEGARIERTEDDEVGSSPTQIANPRLRYEAKKALVWALVIGFVALTVLLAQSLLVIFGAMVFACMIDGGARLLGRALKIGRGWRVAIVLLLTVAFFVWLSMFAGSQISRQAAQFPELVGRQLGLFFGWLEAQGFAVGQIDVRALVENLGTIARSGSRQLMQALAASGEPAPAVGRVISAMAPVLGLVPRHMDEDQDVAGFVLFDQPA